MHSDKGPWKDSEILKVDHNFLLVPFFFSVAVISIIFHSLFSEEITNQLLVLQMVQNGEHKCTKKSKAQSIEEKTILEDENVLSKVLLLMHLLFFFPMLICPLITNMLHVYHLIFLSSMAFFCICFFLSLTE